VTEEGVSQLEMLKAFKRRVLAMVNKASQETGLDIDVSASSVWVDWEQMTKGERIANPDSQENGGFYRIGVEVRGKLTP